MAKSRKRQEGDPSVSDPSDLTPVGTSGSGNGSSGSMADPERISARAYELYLARGGADGQAWDDWLEAERELHERGSSSRGDSGE